MVFIRVVQQDYTGGQKVSREIAGSGVVITEGGEVLTNWHVVDKAGGGAVPVVLMRAAV